MIDGKAAAIAVRNHFEDVHGAYSVIGFQLVNIKKNEDENCWEVSCLFYPGIVDLEDGSILDQEIIIPEKE